MKVGDTFVTGQTETLSSTREVVVVPDGTFRVVGRVVEEDTPDLPVGGVRVEADGGVPSDSTDLEGRYRLYAVPGDAGIRVSKSGYITKELTLAISDHHTQNAALAIAGPPRVDVAGPYQLTIEASPECRGRLPEALLTRRYAAAITQDGAVIRVVLSGANFAIGRFGSRSNVILGRVEPTGVVLELDSATYDTDPTLIEIVEGTTYLVIEGGARLSPAGPSLTGTLAGRFLVYPSDPGRGAPLQASCGSQSQLSHRLTLTR